MSTACRLFLKRGRIDEAPKKRVAADEQEKQH